MLLYRKIFIPASITPNFKVFCESFKVFFLERMNTLLANGEVRREREGKEEERE